MLRRAISRERAASSEAARSASLMLRLPSPVLMLRGRASVSAHRLDNQRHADREHQQREHERGGAMRLPAGHLKLSLGPIGRVRCRSARAHPPRHGSGCQVMIGMIRMATMLATLIIGLIAGPA